MLPLSADAADATFAAPAAPALPRLLVGTTSIAALTAVFVVAAATAATVLFLPGRVFSREMTWDLLFNLDGAWRLAQGQQAYLDFHDPLGVLGLQLTRLGFLVVGTRPMAFLVGECLALAALGLVAVPVAARRLPPLPAGVFVTSMVALVLLPANIGDAPHLYSFAMSYNRLGWAVLTTLCLALFLAPVRPAPRPMGDLAIAGALCLALFHVKVTFAAAAFGAVAAAIVIAPHVQAQRRAWLLLLAALAVYAALPWHHAYLRDAWIIGGARARTDIFYLANTLVANRAEYTLYLLATGVLTWLWMSGRAPASVPLAAGCLTAIGTAVLTQNAQDADIPLGLVIWLTVYTSLGTVTRAMAARERTMLLLLVLLGPMVSLAGAAKVYAGYLRAATAPDVLTAPAGTHLEGLAAERHRGEGPSTAPEGAASQADYVSSLLRAAALVDGRPTRLQVIDQVNPLPFALGFPAPRGGLLWLGPTAPPRTAEELLGDVDVVLIPGHSSNPGVTAMVLDVCRPYLDAHFPVQTTAGDWTILRRTADGAATPPSAR